MDIKDKWKWNSLPFQTNISEQQINSMIKEIEEDILGSVVEREINKTAASQPMFDL